MTDDASKRRWKIGSAVTVEALVQSQAVLVELAELYTTLGHHALGTIRAAEADAVSGLPEGVS